MAEKRLVKPAEDILQNRKGVGFGELRRLLEGSVMNADNQRVVVAITCFAKRAACPYPSQEINQ
jgi:hypothetical protein